MSDEVLRSLNWAGLAVGIVAVFMVLEGLFRSVANRFGTPQDQSPRRAINR